MSFIPKIIHYCWFGPASMNKTIRQCMASWENHLPGYEIRLWNEENSPMEIPFIRQAYGQKKFAFVSDCVRFHVLHEHGGIYLDTDMYVLKNLDPLRSNPVFFGWENAEEDAISCGVIGSEPGNDFIGRILEKYRSLEYESTPLEKMVVPRVVNSCYRDLKQKEHIRIYPYEYFYPFPYSMKENARHFMKYATPDTFAIHLWNISWGTWHAKLRDRVLYHLRLNR